MNLSVSLRLCLCLSLSSAGPEPRASSEPSITHSGLCTRKVIFSSEFKVLGKKKVLGASLVRDGEPRTRLGPLLRLGLGPARPPGPARPAHPSRLQEVALALDAVLHVHQLLQVLLRWRQTEVVRPTSSGPGCGPR